MYFDSKPCQVCGAEIRLQGRTADDIEPEVDPDGTVDARVCTNDDCPTRHGEGEA